MALFERKCTAFVKGTVPGRRGAGEQKGRTGQPRSKKSFSPALKGVIVFPSRIVKGRIFSGKWTPEIVRGA